MKVALAPGGRHWKIGIIGCGWIGGVHAEAIAMLPNAQVTACCGTTMEKSKAFAAKYQIENHYYDYRQLVESSAVEVVIIGTPNYLHHPMTIAALNAGKHVIVEKPLAMSLEECEDIVKTAEKTGCIIGYAEELCFVPKFVRAKQLADAGAIGEVRFIKQCEKHEGPHSRWFYEPNEAGGGITLDMGCHAIEFARWFLGKPKCEAVWSHMNTWLHLPGVHQDVTQEEDHVVIHLEFAGGINALLESSWTLKGGMESKAEIHGTGGVLYADLLQQGMGMKMFSHSGVKGEEDSTCGWSHPDFDWNFQNGYPHEIAHFLYCMENGEKPLESAEDGLAVMEIMLACYQSAGSGQKVKLPFRPQGVKRPMDLWKSPIS